MNKLVCGRQPNCLPERLNVKFSYYLYGMQPTDISSFNNGPVETNNQKKKINIAEIYFRILKTKTKNRHIKADQDGIYSKYNFTIKSSSRRH